MIFGYITSSSTSKHFTYSYLLFAIPKCRYNLIETKDLSEGINVTKPILLIGISTNLCSEPSLLEFINPFKDLSFKSFKLSIKFDMLESEFYFEFKTILTSPLK